MANYDRAAQASTYHYYGGHSPLQFSVGNLIEVYGYPRPCYLGRSELAHSGEK